MSLSQYLDLFLSESREHLAAIERDIARLERSPDDAPALQELFRHAHSIKGMSASMGYPAIAEVAHAIEQALDRVQRRLGPFDAELKAAVLLAFDGIDRMISLIATKGDEAIDTVPMLAPLERIERRFAGGAHAAQGTGRPGPEAGAERRPIPSGTEAPRSGAREAPGGKTPARGEAPLVCIKVHFEPGSSLPSARAAVAVKRLERHGVLVRCAPTLEQLARREFEGDLEVLLRTHESPGQIAEEIRRLTDVRSVEAAPTALGPDGHAPPGAARAGEGRAVPAGSPRSAADGNRSHPAAGDSLGDAPGETLASAPRDASAAGDPAPATTVRVPAPSLDRFLDTIGELIVQRGRLTSLLEPIGDRSVKIALDRLKSLTDRLFGDVMALRMLPFDTITHRFARSVRELAERQQKRVSLGITGGEVLLDRSILEELSDPINHLLRNAVDHGIESPHDRGRAGKPEEGSILISLKRTGDAVTLRIEDDGRGMDPDLIREAALRKGFITPERLREIGDQEALMLTTVPGFSTADRVTDVSGRGVGMDVVRTRVETLGGRLKLHSRPGRGLTVAMRLPLTIVVVKAFLVEAGGRRWAVPLASVRRTLAPEEGRIVRRGDRDYIGVDGEEGEIPLLDLAATLGIPSGAVNGGRGEALIASDREPGIAFAVDRIVGRREIVVKPLRQPLEELRGFSGATILEDGSIALILDLPSLAPL